MDEKFPVDKTLPPEMIGPGNQNYEFLKHTLDVSKQRAKEIKGVQDSEAEMPYHKLEFTDEAANNIINGEGQSLPGYKKGGSVKMAGGGSPSDTVEVGTPMAKAMGTYSFQQSEAPLEAPMFSPDDLIGTGIGKAALGLGVGAIKKVAPKELENLLKKLTPEEIAYRNEFTHGLYHGTTAPENIGKGFSSAYESTHVTTNPIFAADYAGNITKEMTKKGAGYNNYGYNYLGETDLTPGGTIYPLSARLGKVFEPNTSDAKKAIEQYSKQHSDWPLEPAEKTALLKGHWEDIESNHNFVDYLKQRYDSIGSIENGVKNYRIFDQSRIRSPFAKFDPSEANSTDLLKAEGGSVKKIDTKSKNSDIMHQSLAQMRAEILRRKHG